MEKKHYVKPTVEFIHLDKQDIITTSGGCWCDDHNKEHNHDHHGGNKPWNPWGWGWWPWHW